MNPTDQAYEPIIENTDSMQDTDQRLPAMCVENWPAVQSRWAAWWEREIVDRVVIQVTAPKERTEGEPRNGLNVDPRVQWTDAGFMIRRTEEMLRTTYFGGDAIPWCWNPISAGHALYFGCTPHFAPDTMWLDPAPVSEDGFPTLDGWRDSAAWQWARECTAAFAAASGGRYFVLPFWGNHAADILAMVRGVDTFYLDFALYPAWITSAVKAMSDILIVVHEELGRMAYSPIARTAGSLNYCGCWSPVQTLAFDCDVSCNVSGEAFRQMLLPPLVESMQRVDHRIYHLDGRGALHHLDTLLALPELHAIQWVPGRGTKKYSSGSR
jgi:hypothetical protein